MPTYQYSCTECGHFFEQFQSFSEDSLKVCPQCQGQLRKVFNAVGVVFKGSGFYRTDSRAPAAANGSPKPAAESTTGASAGSTTETTAGSSTGASAPANAPSTSSGKGSGNTSGSAA